MHRHRLIELALLVPALCLAGVSFAVLSMVRRTPVALDLWPLAVLVIVFLAIHFVLVWRYPSADQLLLPLVAALCSLGFFVIARTDAELLPRQALWLALGVVLFLGVVLPEDVVGALGRYRYIWGFMGAGILLGTFVFGVDPNASGVRIWVGYGPYLFQPAELVKICMVAFLAAYLDDKRELLAMGVYRLGPLRLPPWPYLAPSLAMLGVCLLLFLVQHDLGVTFLFFGVFVAMLYAVSGRGVYVLAGLAILAGASYVVHQLFSVARVRVDMWLNPWADAQGRGFQIIQALVAFASGGVLGTGPGYGSPGLIPAAFTDFPFAVIGEELGLAGTLAVVAVYVMLTVRGFRISLDIGSSFRGLLSMGLITTLGLQALIILAGNLKLVPLTGITLPFVSYGGSSLVTNFIILGLLLRLSAETPRTARG